MKILPEEWGWHYNRADVVHIGGPVRVVVNDPAPMDWKPSRIGFTPRPIEAEPALWDGDQA